MKKFLIGLCLVIIFTFSAIGLAACSPEEYNVNFIVDGVTVKTVQTSGQGTVELPTTPSKTGYIFDGWYLDNTTWESVFNSNTLVTSPISGDINVYAKFTESHIHEYQTVVKAPTCEEGGYTLHKCACGDEYIDQETKKLGHKYGDWESVKAPTCTEKGEEKSVCANDETHVLTREVEALGHDFGEWTVTIAPTCTEKGEETRVCSRCGEKETREIDALNHKDLNYVENKAVVHCTDKNHQGVEGMQAHYYCSACNTYFDSDKVETTKEALTIKVSHLFDDAIVEPTCDKKGYTLHTCTICGYVTMDNYTDPIGHDFEGAVYVSDNNATFEADGTKTATCKRAGCYETNTVTEEGSKLKIKLETFNLKQETIDGKKVYTASGRVSNTTAEFDFAKEITNWDENVSFKVCTELDAATAIAPDAKGQIMVSTKDGENTYDYTYYILIYVDDIYNSFYTVNIHRNKIFTVTFNANGGNWTQLVTTEFKVIEENSATAPEIDPVRDSYTFAGWDKDVAAPINEDTTFTAQWVQYRLTTLVNDSAAGVLTTSYDNSAITAGNKVILTANTNDSYSFDGWYDGVKLISRDEAFEFEMPSENITLMAKWTQYTFNTGRNASDAGKVYVDNVESPVNSDSKAVSVGTKITIKAETNDGYSFDGWYYFDTLVSEESTYTFTMPAKNITYDAHWSRYTFTSNINNEQAGTISKFYDKEYVSAGKEVTLMAITNDGYTFEGWFMGNESEPKSTEETYTFNMPKASVVYTAKWIANSDTKYTINYYKEDRYGGYLLDNTVYDCGTTNTLVDFVVDVTYDNFIFNKNKSVTNANISGDGSMTLSLYYDRVFFNVVVWADSGINITVGGVSITDYNDGAFRFVDGAYRASFKYETIIPDIAASVVGGKLGYKTSWYYDGDLLNPLDSIGSFPALKDVECSARLIVEPEMSNFNFESTDASCTITSVKNKSVTEIFIPKYVTVIAADAFDGCNNLVTISVSADNENYSTYEGVLYNKDRTEIIYVPLKISDNFTLSNMITNIAADIFSGRGQITGIKFNGTVDEWNGIVKADGWNNGLQNGCKLYCNGSTLVIA